MKYSANPISLTDYIDQHQPAKFTFPTQETEIEYVMDLMDEVILELPWEYMDMKEGEEIFSYMFPEHETIITKNNTEYNMVIRGHKFEFDVSFDASDFDGEEDA